MTGVRLYASLAAEEAECLECCRFAVQVAHRKYDAGAALSETEAGLDARTVYIALSRRAGASIPTPPPPAHPADSSAASTPPDAQSDASKSEPRLSGEASPVSAAAKSGGVEPPQQSPEGVWYFSCATCGKRKRWRGHGNEAPWPGAKCWECWREAVKK